MTRGIRQEGFPQPQLLQKLRGPAMSRKSRKDPVRSEKSAVLDLGGVTFTSMGAFKSWHWCPLRSVVKGGKSQWKMHGENTSESSLTTPVFFPRDKSTRWPVRFIEHIL